MCPATNLQWRNLGPTDPFVTFSFAVALRSRVGAFQQLRSKTPRAFGQSSCRFPSFARFFRKVRRHFSELQLVDIRRRLIASSTQFDGCPRFPLVSDHVITIGWSRKAAAHSSRGLTNRPRASTLRNVSTSPQELREALLVHTVCCVRFWPKLLGMAVVELGLLLLWGVDHADGRDCSAGFLLGHFCTFFSLAHRRRKPLEFELHLSCIGFACLVSSVAILTRSASHALYNSRGLNSRLRKP